jgi:hypothetical protein
MPVRNGTIEPNLALSIAHQQRPPSATAHWAWSSAHFFFYATLEWLTRLSFPEAEQLTGADKY